MIIQFKSINKVAVFDVNSVVSIDIAGAQPDKPIRMAISLAHDAFMLVVNCDNDTRERFVKILADREVPPAISMSIIELPVSSISWEKI